MKYTAHIFAIFILMPTHILGLNLPEVVSEDHILPDCPGFSRNFIQSIEYPRYRVISLQEINNLTVLATNQHNLHHFFIQEQTDCIQNFIKYHQSWYEYFSHSDFSSIKFNTSFLNSTGWELIPSSLTEYPDENYYFKIVQFSSVFNRKYQINRYSMQAYQICEELVPGFSFLLTEKYQTIGKTVQNLFQKRGILIKKCRNQTLNGCLFTTV